MMMGFMARTGLYLSVFPNIADMPRDVPTDKEELRTFKGAYETETKAAFRLSNITRRGATSNGVLHRTRTSSTS